MTVESYQVIHGFHGPSCPGGRLRHSLWAPTSSVGRGQQEREWVRAPAAHFGMLTVAPEGLVKEKTLDY